MCTCARWGGIRKKPEAQQTLSQGPQGLVKPLMGMKREGILNDKLFQSWHFFSLIEIPAPPILPSLYSWGRGGPVSTLFPLVPPRRKLLFLVREPFFLKPDFLNTLRGEHGCESRFEVAHPEPCAVSPSLSAGRCSLQTAPFSLTPRAVLTAGGASPARGQVRAVLGALLQSPVLPRLHSAEGSPTRVSPLHLELRLCSVHMVPPHGTRS